MDDYAHLGPVISDAIAALEDAKRGLLAHRARLQRAAAAQSAIHARPPKGSVWFTVPQAARVTGLSETTVRRMVRDGRLTKGVYDGRVHVSKQELDRLR